MSPIISLMLLALQALLLAGKNFRILSESVSEYTRYDFPSDFVFGAGTSAVQYEGAMAEDGRTPSIWDGSTNEEQKNGVSESDGYHKYKEDIELMRKTGLEGYRFSISWSRLLPDGRGAVNPKGLAYYNNVLNELTKHGIKPHVALHQLDFPQVLEDEYGGWLSPRIVDDFKEYAEVCFREFGDRISHWTTMIEPNINALASYDIGGFPPYRCSDPFGYYSCREGNSSVEPYIAAHNMILAHAGVVNLYREKYQAVQKGKVGINLYTAWFSPYTDSTEDVLATQRTLDFIIGWFMNPLVFGDYPDVMKQNAGSRLPKFSESESVKLKGAIDFVGINYYLEELVADDSDASKTGPRDVNADMFALFTVSKDVPPVSQFLPPSNAPKNPSGLRKMLNYIKVSYGNLPVYIHENGYGLGVKDTLNDTGRISFISGFIGSTLDALRDGSDVRGYFVWSFIDVYELLGGYKTRFGLYNVDFENAERPRVPKLSAIWYSNFLKNGSVVKIENVEEEAANLSAQ